MPDSIRHLTLPNGLHLTLRHAPRLKRAAAALRVHAGSHDAPADWPGLAHFLEHLFFLGTHRFPLEDGLMRYVQAVGGQVNASTRERTTEFFFELAPEALPGGLERLCQMLAEPELDIARQRREREVIHAEFIAWARNPEAQRQFARLQSVSPRHPLSGFHAGNRYSLALGDARFQQALVQFHQRFYQGGQITLSLAGPQPLDTLEQLGAQYAALFAAGQHACRQAPPALLDGPLRTPEASDLLFAHENLPHAAEQALELLLGQLTDNRPGTWLGALQQRGWLRECTAQVLYSYAGQMFWQLNLQLTEQACRAEAQALLHGWLGFLARQGNEQLNHSHAQLQRRLEQAASALELARRGSAGLAFDGLDSHGLAALDALLGQLPQAEHGDWALPAPEPLLHSAPDPRSAPLPGGLKLSDALPASREFAALYLRWQVRSPLRSRVQPVLERALRPLQARAERAALQLGFSAAGEDWQLRIAGQPQAVTRAAAEALALLRQPPTEAWLAQLPEAPGLIPLRALLKALPNALYPADTQAQPACVVDQPLLDRLWQHSRWQGLAVGFDSAGHGALGAALEQMMGAPGDTTTRQAITGRRWQQVGSATGEAAVLLFCPLPAELEAPGRLLAHLLQGPVYQRLRVELQLGYAVFSAFRQVEGVGGLLFGVQSPKASHAQILEHLLALLGAGVQLDDGARRQLAEQFSEARMDNAEIAEWAWQAHMAKHISALTYIQSSILKTAQHSLDDLLQQLISARHGWLCLANAAAPDAGWL